MANGVKKEVEKESMRESTKKSPEQLCDEKLTAIDIDIQKELNKWYLRPEYNALDEKQRKFKPGDEVVSISKGIYYQVKIVAYESETIIPDSLFLKPGTKLPDEKKVPVVQIKFEGWGPKYNEKVSENEVHTVKFPGAQHETLALLVAHEWNLLQCERWKLAKITDLGTSSFLMGAKSYEKVMKRWQKDSGETIPFEQFCGRVPPSENF